MRLLPDHERELLRRASDWPREILNAERLAQLAKDEGHAFATAVVYDRLRRTHAAFVEHLDSLPEPTSDQLRRLPGRVAVVPGAFYRDFPETGADGHRILDYVTHHGGRAERVPLLGFGALAENARRLADWLDRQHDGPLVLVSLSKGAADVKTALALPGASAAFRNVRGWISLSGIIYGTAIANWLLERWFYRLACRPLLWWRGHRYGVLRELVHGPRGPLATELTWPKDLRVVHLAGLPLQAHLTSRLARRAYQRLESLGPSDGGGILLADLLRLPGLLYPVWGADHYLRPANWDILNLVGRVWQFALAEQTLDTLAPGNAPGAHATYAALSGGNLS